MLGDKRCRIDPGTFQNDMTSIASRDDLFTLFVHLGYLAYDFDSREVFIPNEEVRGEFVRAVKGSRGPELRLILVGLNNSTKTGKHTCKIEEYKV